MRKAGFNYIYNVTANEVIPEINANVIVKSPLGQHIGRFCQNIFPHKYRIKLPRKPQVVSLTFPK